MLQNIIKKPHVPNTQFLPVVTFDMPYWWTVQLTRPQLSGHTQISPEKKNLFLKSNIIKVLDDNIGEYIHDLRINKYFLSKREVQRIK